MPFSCQHVKSCSRLNVDEWKGDVVAGDGRIRGCRLEPVEGSLTEWTLAIDGVEADLGRFSEAIYKKVTQDAKQQRFQGFRPGTIPPHLEPTYRAFAMDECARETVLEALQQNNIRPFESARAEIVLEDFSVPPAPKKGKNKRKKGAAVTSEEEPDEEPQWRFFATMKEAVDAGWRPGQSFSFVAKKVKGQRLKDEAETSGAKPLGLNY